MVTTALNLCRNPATGLLSAALSIWKSPRLLLRSSKCRALVSAKPAALSSESSPLLLGSQGVLQPDCPLCCSTGQGILYGPISATVALHGEQCRGLGLGLGPPCFPRGKRPRELPRATQRAPWSARRPQHPQPRGTRCLPIACTPLGRRGQTSPSGGFTELSGPRYQGCRHSLRAECGTESNLQPEELVLPAGHRVAGYRTPKRSRRFLPTLVLGAKSPPRQRGHSGAAQAGPPWQSSPPTRSLQERTLSSLWADNTVCFANRLSNCK